MSDSNKELPDLDECRKIVFDHNNDNTISTEIWVCPYCECCNMHFVTCISHVPDDTSVSKKQYIIDREPIVTLETYFPLSYRNREFYIQMTLQCESCEDLHFRIIAFHKGGIYQDIRKFNKCNLGF